MNQQRLAKDWGRLNGHPKQKRREPADGGLLVVKGKRARARPHQGIADANPLARPVNREMEGSGPDKLAAPLRADDQRRALLALRAQLQGDLIQAAESTLGNGIETTVGAPDEVDSASDIVEQDLAVSLLGSATVTLEQIEAALQRMAEGNYGRCLECNARIPAARLEAVPYATCCVSCAARQERAA